MCDVGRQSRAEVKGAARWYGVGSDPPAKADGKKVSVVTANGLGMENVSITEGPG